MQVKTALGEVCPPPRHEGCRMKPWWPSRLVSTSHVRPQQQGAFDPAVRPVEHRLPQRYLLALRVHPVDRLRPRLAYNTPRRRTTTGSRFTAVLGKKRQPTVPYSITERRVPELIPVLGSQPAGDVSLKTGCIGDCDLNPDPSVPESSTLTTRLPSHPLAVFSTHKFTLGRYKF